MILRGELLEHAEYVNHYYGTSLKLIREKLDAGVDVLLDIEVQGAAKVRKRCPDALFIFIIPPSFEELSRRLHRRNTDSEEVIQGRLEKAKVEFQQVHNYDYLVINDKVSGAVAEIEAILAKFRNEEMSVDALAAEVRRATTLIAFCRKRLLKAESDVKKITGE